MGIQTPRGQVALLGWLCPRAQLCPLPADRAVLPPDAVGVFTALGLNERLFVVSRDELGSLVSLGRGSGVGRTSLPPSEGLMAPRFGGSVPPHASPVLR